MNEFSESRVGVMVATFNRGDEFDRLVTRRFLCQTHRKKKLFVCRNSSDSERRLGKSPHAIEACKRWRRLQAEHPESVLFWELDDYQSLGHKRNLMLDEMVKDEHQLDFICVMDDDDAYAPNYIEEMLRHFQESPRLQLVNFRDSLCIQIRGQPVRLDNPEEARIGAVLQALEGSRAYIEAMPGEAPPTSSREADKWHVHSRGGVLPSGFGYSFVFRASSIRGGNSDIRYAHNSQSRSGEEDALYLGIKDHFGPDAIKDLPLSESHKLACHLENGKNVSGDMDVFHFPAQHYVDVPRPLSFVPDSILELVRHSHPAPAFRRWATAVLEVRRFCPLHATATYVANQREIRGYAENWANCDNWTSSAAPTCPFFVPPVGQRIPAGQDIPIEAKVPNAQEFFEADYAPAQEPTNARFRAKKPR